MPDRGSPPMLETIREHLTAGGVHTLLVQFTDLHGTPKGKLVPLEHLDAVIAIGEIGRAHV